MPNRRSPFQRHSPAILFAPARHAHWMVQFPPCGTTTLFADSTAGFLRAGISAESTEQPIRERNSLPLSHGHGTRLAHCCSRTLCRGSAGSMACCSACKVKSKTRHALPFPRFPLPVAPGGNVAPQAVPTFALARQSTALFQFPVKEAVLAHWLHLELATHLAMLHDQLICSWSSETAVMPLTTALVARPLRCLLMRCGESVAG